MNKAPISPTPAEPTLFAVGMAVLGVALLWLPVLALHLTPALFAVPITYAATRNLAARLHNWQPKHGFAYAFAPNLELRKIAIFEALDPEIKESGKAPSPHETYWDSEEKGLSLHSISLQTCLKLPLFHG